MSKGLDVDLTRCRLLMTKFPRVYLGIDLHMASVIDVLAYKIKVPKISLLTATDIVNLVLRKIRLNESFEILANEFGL